MTAKEKIRLNLDISPKANDNLNDLKNRTESPSVAEVLRRAIALYDLVTTHIEKDGTIILKHKDGQQEVLRLL